MFCIYCGAPIPEDACFCAACGRPVYRAASGQDFEEATLPEETQQALFAQKGPCSSEPGTADIPENFFSDTLDLPEKDPPSAADQEPDESTLQVFPVLTPEESQVPSGLPPEETSVPPRTPRRAVLLPLGVLTGLFLIGLALFFCFPFVYDMESDGPSPSDPNSVQGSVDPLDPEKKPGLPGSDASSLDLEPTAESCFKISGGAVTFLPEKFDGGTVVVIPEELHGETVTSIADFGFAQVEGISTIILPNTLRSIGQFSFQDCQDLRGIYIPESVTRIGKGAFSLCRNMEAAHFPAGLESIGPDAFDGCASLLFFFYDGTFEQWESLYNEYVTPYTSVTCTDGEYYHGVQIP